MPATLLILMLALTLAGCSSPTSPHAIDKAAQAEKSVSPAVDSIGSVATESFTLTGSVLTGGTWEKGPPVDGVPVPGVRVRVQQDDRLVELTTDANGSYTVSGLHAGVVRVDLKKEGYLSRSTSLSINNHVRLYSGLVPGWEIPKLDLFLNVTLSGVVYEETPSGRLPIPHASVYCEPCDEGTHAFATTDDSGFYSFTGVWTDAGHFPTRILVSKDGYTDPAGLPVPTPGNPSGPGWREVVVTGDTRFDMELVRR